MEIKLRKFYKRVNYNNSMVAQPAVDESRRSFCIDGARALGALFALAGCGEPEKGLDHVAKLLDVGQPEEQEPEPDLPSLDFLLETFRFRTDIGRKETITTAVLQSKTAEPKFVRIAAEYILGKYDLIKAFTILRNSRLDSSQKRDLVTPFVEQYLEEERFDLAVRLAEGFYERAELNEVRHQAMDYHLTEARKGFESEHLSHFETAYELAVKIGEPSHKLDDLAYEATLAHLKTNSWKVSATDHARKIKDPAKLRELVESVVIKGDSTPNWVSLAKDNGFDDLVQAMYWQLDEHCDFSTDWGWYSMDDCIELATMAGKTKTAERFKKAKASIQQRVKTWIAQAEEYKQAGNLDKARAMAISAISALRRYDGKIRFDDKRVNDKVALGLTRKYLGNASVLHFLAREDPRDTVEFVRKHRPDLSKTDVMKAVWRLNGAFTRDIAAELADSIGEKELAKRLYQQCVTDSLWTSSWHQPDSDDYNRAADYAAQVDKKLEAKYRTKALQLAFKEGKTDLDDGVIAQKLGLTDLAHRIYTRGLTDIEACHTDVAQSNRLACWAFTPDRKGLSEIVETTFGPRRQVAFYSNIGKHDTATRLAEGLQDDDLLLETVERAGNFVYAARIEQKRGNTERERDYRVLAASLPLEQS